MARGERTIRNISRGNTKAFTVSKTGSNSFFNTNFVGNFKDKVVIEEDKTKHSHTLETIVTNAKMINEDTCSVTTVTKCSDANCPNPSEVYKEETETRNHKWIKDYDDAQDLGGGLLLVPSHCEYCNYPGPDEYVDNTANG